jgi:hypothetical protein
MSWRRQPGGDMIRAWHRTLNPRAARALCCTAADTPIRLSSRALVGVRIKSDALKAFFPHSVEENTAYRGCGVSTAIAATCARLRNFAAPPRNTVRNAAVFLRTYGSENTATIATQKLYSSRRNR